jgi:hypothetical protein
MKIKLIGLAALLLGMVGLGGCYDVGPYGGGGYMDPPATYGAVGGGYYPGAYYAGGPGYGWAPGYWGRDGYWGHNEWDHNHWNVPEHGGFVAHNYGAPAGARGFAVAHNEGFRGGSSFHGAAGGGFHAANVGGAHGGGGHSGASHGASHSSNHR